MYICRCLLHTEWICLEPHSYICDMTYSSVWYDSTLVSVWHDLFTSAPWPIAPPRASFIHLWHDFFTSAPWPIAPPRAAFLYLWHDWFISVSWHIHICSMTHCFAFAKPHFYICDVTYSSAWHDSCISVTWLICVAVRRPQDGCKMAARWLQHGVVLRSLAWRQGLVKFIFILLNCSAWWREVYLRSAFQFAAHTRCMLWTGGWLGGARGRCEYFIKQFVVFAHT